MNDAKREIFLTGVAEYYSNKIKVHGQSARGVDWNGEEGQRLRFKQLCKIINENTNFTINDLGCGYGALYDYMSKHYSEFKYMGIDISESMIKTSRKRYKNNKCVYFYQSGSPKNIADYGIASGIFNVRLSNTDSEWLEYIETSLDSLDNTSRLAFSFNCLTKYSDNHKKRDYLYYADPCYLFDMCKQKYSHDIALLHDYGLYEFTILVRKQL